MSHSTHPVADSLDAALRGDPRVSESYVRRVESGPEPVVLVGVVHDHPASVHRAAAVVDAVAPETVAVELPDLVVPAIGPDETDGVGGEMAAAMAAATGSVTGIDVPGRGTARALLAEVRDRRAAPRTVLRGLWGVGRIATHAVLGRLARLELPGTPAVEDVEETREYDLPAGASARAEADHERAHLRRSTTLLRSFEPPAATRFLDGVRERYMAERLRALRPDGPVVAVVGYGHLDAIAAALDDEAE